MKRNIGKLLVLLFLIFGLQIFWGCENLLLADLKSTIESLVQSAEDEPPTHEEIPQFSVVYDGNGSTLGTVPIDENTYVSGDIVTVKDNTGDLNKTGCKFTGWNTDSIGSGTHYESGLGVFTIQNSDEILYAEWDEYSVHDTGPAGGYVFYDKGFYSGGWRYLEAAPNDQSLSTKWSTIYTKTSATETAVGTGDSNTAKMAVTNMGSPAADICLSLSIAGYEDWYLPSKDELNEMYLIRGSIGGFSISEYWSSTEYNQGTTPTSAWVESFDAPRASGYQDKKLNSLGIRSIRKF